MLPVDFEASMHSGSTPSASRLARPSQALPGYPPLNPTGYAFVELSAAPASPPSLNYSKYKWMAHAARQGALASPRSSAASSPGSGSGRSSHAAFSPLPSPDSRRAASPLRVDPPPLPSPLAAPPTAGVAGALPAAALPVPAPSPAAGAQQPRPAASGPAIAAQPLPAAPLAAAAERGLAPWWRLLAALALCLLAPMAAPALHAYFATKALLRKV